MSFMLVLITYDVNTVTPAGKTRSRKVAKDLIEEAKDSIRKISGDFRAPGRKAAGEYPMLRRGVRICPQAGQAMSFPERSKPVRVDFGIGRGQPLRNLPGTSQVL